ncbi:unnamed protein product [Linum tenue]|uniref:Uncharacterized protein n=1 Tax=Linum tenue TaxID=586396 RepID=A0AAV0K233_9ROSI|nr:unnamed protein product [Linum tenue]
MLTPTPFSLFCALLLCLPLAVVFTITTPTTTVSPAADLPQPAPQRRQLPPPPRRPGQPEPDSPTPKNRLPLPHHHPSPLRPALGALLQPNRRRVRGSGHPLRTHQSPHPDPRLRRAPPPRPRAAPRPGQRGLRPPLPVGGAWGGRDAAGGEARGGFPDRVAVLVADAEPRADGGRGPHDLAEVQSDVREGGHVLPGGELLPYAHPHAGPAWRHVGRAPEDVWSG